MARTVCKDCEFRRVGCHAECDIYKKWHEEREREIFETSRTNCALNSMWSYGKNKRRRKF